MPQAVKTVETETVELNSVPGGSVELRRFTYGEQLKMRSISSRMSMSGFDPKRSDQDNAEASLELDLQKLNFYKFSKAIVNHNLEDDRGRKLNFNNRADFDRLDPSVGQEIEAAIERLNPDEAAALDDGENPLGSDSTEQ